MIMKQFEGISLLGRISYAIMCAEKYLTTIHPDRNWRPLFELLWSICKEETFWDEWASKVIEVVPKYLFEFPTFEESDFEYLDKEGYETMKTLLIDHDAGTDTLLEGIVDMEEAYAYTEISGIGEESLDILGSIIKVLKDGEIPLPDPQVVAFSSFKECNGRGNSFDCRPLSIVL